MRWMKIAAAVMVLSGLMIMSGPVPVTGQDEATNLGPVVNSPDSDFGPIVTADGNALYFTSDREGGFGGQDIWVSRRQNGEWTRPANLGDQINTKYNEGPDTLSVDERIMFFTRCDKEKNKGNPGTCDIYMTSWDEAANGWAGAAMLGNGVNSRYNDANASLSYDASTLYFVSDRPTDDKKFKSWDIFVAHKQGSDWGQAERVGPPINTQGDEFHVMIHQDNQTLYFSSDGHGGFGGADIFVSRITNGAFGEPQNLGPLINTPENDMYFTIPASGDLAYFASNRAGTAGLEDIYSVPIPPELGGKGVIIVKGIVADRTTCTSSTIDPATQTKVYDIHSCTPINKASVRLADVMTDIPIKESVTGPSGFYQVAIPAGNDYSITATAPQYSFHTERFNVARTQPYQVIEKNILLDPAKVGTIFIINNLYFDFDKSTLRPESKNELNNAIRWLNSNPNAIIEIGGHTDAKGSDTYNIKLSQNRAKSVYDYLVQNGINPSRLQAHGYGERMPIATNSTDVGRQYNRRVEFKILQ
ncbi:MAG TPA: OmpA family protein [bacterium]|nr:OmpA family protein [bacterium]